MMKTSSRRKKKKSESRARGFDLLIATRDDTGNLNLNAYASRAI